MRSSSDRSGQCGARASGGTLVMRVRRFLLTALVVTWTAAPGYAQWVATPYLGMNVSGDVEQRKGGPGGSISYFGGLVGFEFDFQRLWTKTSARASCSGTTASGAPPSGSQWSSHGKTGICLLETSEFRGLPACPLHPPAPRDGLPALNVYSCAAIHWHTCSSSWVSSAISSGPCSTCVAATEAHFRSLPGHSHR